MHTYALRVYVRTEGEASVFLQECVQRLEAVTLAVGKNARTQRRAAAAQALSVCALSNTSCSSVHTSRYVAAKPQHSSPHASSPSAAAVKVASAVSGVASQLGKPVVMASRRWPCTTVLYMHGAQSSLQTGQDRFPRLSERNCHRADWVWDQVRELAAHHVVRRVCW